MQRNLLKHTQVLIDTARQYSITIAADETKAKNTDTLFFFTVFSNHCRILKCVT